MNSASRAIVASIVVPSHRGAARLPALCDSLATQSPHTPRFEIIVVVDGDDDGSAALLEREDRIEVRVIEFPENRGRVAALNAGFESARGDVLIRCDDDLIVPDDYVTAHVQAHAGPHQIGAIGLTRDVHSASPYARAYGEDAAVRAFAWAQSRGAEERWRLWAANCSVSRATWERVGAYDSRYQSYGWEDIDYGYRLHEADIPLVIVDDALAEHKGPARSARARALKAFDAGQARSKFWNFHPEAALGDTSAGHGIWGTAVKSAARMLRSRTAVGNWAACVDRLLPITSRPIGRKLTALCVEGASLAGSRALPMSEGRSRRWRDELR